MVQPANRGADPAECRPVAAVRLDVEQALGSEALPNHGMPNAFDFSSSPFDCLDADEQQVVRERVDIGYFREGETLLDPGDETTHLFIVIKGRVSQFDDRAILSPNIFGYLWSKLSYGALLFATAVTNDGIADALARPEDRELYTELGREVLRVAAAQGVTPEAFNGFDPAAFMPGATTAQAVASLDDMVAFNHRSAKTHSGIWRDLAVRKRRTEVDAQLGWVVRFGQQHAVPTPLTTRLVELVHDIEDGRRELDSANLDELRGLLHPETV